MATDPNVLLMRVRAVNEEAAVLRREGWRITLTPNADGGVSVKIDRTDSCAADDERIHPSGL